MTHLRAVRAGFRADGPAEREARSSRWAFVSPINIRRAPNGSDVASVPTGMPASSDGLVTDLATSRARVCWSQPNNRRHRLGR